MATTKTMAIKEEKKINIPENIQIESGICTFYTNDKKLCVLQIVITRDGENYICLVEDQKEIMKYAREGKQIVKEGLTVGGVTVWYIEYKKTEKKQMLEFVKNILDEKIKEDVEYVIYREEILSKIITDDIERFLHN